MLPAPLCAVARFAGILLLIAAAAGAQPVPPAGGFILVPTRSLNLRDDNVAPIALTKRRVSFRLDTQFEQSAEHVIVVPAPNSGDDPRIGGATLRVYNSNPATGAPTDDEKVNLSSTL